MLLNRLLILSMMFSFVACFSNNNKKENSAELKVIAGNWGHLSQASLQPGSPLYLINKDPNQNYEICVAEYLIQKFPGIEEEIKASVNIWAYYIGREIKVNLNIEKLPRATKSQSVDELTDIYYKICGSKTELVIGLGPLKGNLGRVNSTYQYDNKLWNKKRELKITNFKQTLFLQDENFDNFSYKFISLQNFLNLEEAKSSDDIVALLKSRSEVFYPKLYGQITLATLIHEMGHVWGLCDQYDSIDNCDPKHSSLTQNGKIKRDDDGIMGRGKNEFYAYLRDDDIKGIRELALRKGFNAQLNLTNEEINFDVPEIENKKVDILETNSFEVQEDKLLINLLFVVSQDYKLEVKVWSDAQGWLSYKYGKHNEIPFSSSNYSLELPKPSNALSKIQRVKVILSLLDDSETKVLNLVKNEN